MEVEVIGKELQQYKTSDAEIAKRRQEYMPLSIKDENDEPGYKIVHSARMDIKGCRVAVTKKGKDLREDAVAFQKAVIAEEKRILSQLEPIESHLEQEENRYNEAKERLKRAAAEKEAAILKERVNGLFALGCRYDGENYSYADLVIPQALLKVCDDSQYATFVAAVTEVVEKEQATKAAEEAARKAESERLAKVAAEQEAERARLAAEAKKLQDERESMDRERKAAEDAKTAAEIFKKRAEEMEIAKKEAAEKAVKDSEAKRVQAEADKKAKEEAARIKAERKAARQPDKVKLTSLVDDFFKMDTPDVKTEEGKMAYTAICEILETAEANIRRILDAL